MNNFVICFWCTERCNEGPRHSSGRRRKISSKRQKMFGAPDKHTAGAAFASIKRRKQTKRARRADCRRENASLSAARGKNATRKRKLVTVIHMLGLILIKMLHLVHDHASAQMWSIANKKRQKHARRTPIRQSGASCVPGPARQRRIFMTMLERNANANHRFVVISLRNRSVDRRTVSARSRT